MSSKTLGIERQDLSRATCEMNLTQRPTRWQQVTSSQPHTQESTCAHPKKIWKTRTRVLSREWIWGDSDFTSTGIMITFMFNYSSTEITVRAEVGTLSRGPDTLGYSVKSKAFDPGSRVRELDKLRVITYVNLMSDIVQRMSPQVSRDRTYSKKSRHSGSIWVNGSRDDSWRTSFPVFLHVRSHVLSRRASSHTSASSSRNGRASMIQVTRLSDFFVCSSLRIARTFRRNFVLHP